MSGEKSHIKQMLFFLRGITLGLYNYPKLWQHFKVQYYSESCYFCRMETTLSQSRFAHLPRASVCLCALCPPVFALLCEPTQVPASGRRPRWPPLQVSCQPSRPSPEPDCQNEGRARGGARRGEAASRKWPKMVRLCETTHLGEESK